MNGLKKGYVDAVQKEDIAFWSMSTWKRTALLKPYQVQITLKWIWIGQFGPKICMGTAHDLSYLHEELVPHIIHQDIKAHNVLLGRDLNPKITDFGLAKLFPENVTHISTWVVGTIGYLAPRYAMHGQLTKKAG